MSNTQTPAPENSQAPVLSAPPAGALPEADKPAEKATAASAQTPVVEITDAEMQAAITKAKTEATANERDRCLTIMSAASEIGLSDKVALGQIEAGASADTAGKVMLSIKEGIDASVQIDTQHTAGATSEPKAEMPTYGDIYSKRNARHS